MGKILVVDDAAFMRMMIKDIISKSGHEVVAEAENGVEAVEKYKDVKPDLVTLDVTMPKMDGIDALQKIREFDPKAKVVMCTAMGQQAMLVDAISKGASDYIVKPFDNDKVLSIINKLLAS